MATIENKREIFRFESYRDYLANRFSTHGPSRGLRSKLAERLPCKVSFVSQVIHGNANFSFEQAVVINDFLEHTEEEGDYFLLLVHYAKAGSKRLETYYLNKIEKIRKRRETLSERFKSRKELSPEDQIRYYSAWYYSAIHILTAVPEFRTVDVLVKHLHLPKELVLDVLEFLASISMVIKEGAQYRFSKVSLYLSGDMVNKHHTNWRMRAIQAFDTPSKENLFFSGPVSISKEAAAIIRQRLVKFLDEQQPLIIESKGEVVYCLSVDYFKV